MLPTPQQSSHSSIKATPWQTEMENQESGSSEKEFEGQHRWNARDKTVIAQLEQYLKKSDSTKGRNWGAGVLAWSRRVGSRSEANLEVCEQEEWQDLRNLQLERTE